MSDRYPGFDLWAQRDSASWNAQTRAVIEERLRLSWEPQFFGPEEWRTLLAVCDRIVPRPGGRPRLAAAVLVDRKMAADKGDGYRDARLPPMQEAWRRGLRAVDAEAMAAHAQTFAALKGADQDALLRAVQAGHARTPVWGDMPPALFFQDRVLHDVVAAYYAFPAAWEEIGFGGPASPRGYVRMGFNRRDPWEGVEAPLKRRRHAG